MMPVFLLRSMSMSPVLTVSQRKVSSKKELTERFEDQSKRKLSISSRVSVDTTVRSGCTSSFTSSCGITYRSS